MPFKCVILMSDALLYTLIVGIVIFFFIVSRHEYMRTPWRRVLSKPLAMMSLILLLVYATVGTLDSIHLRLKLPDGLNANEVHYSPDVTSVLDLLINPLGQNDEETYSSPFATHLLSKAIEKTVNGTIRQYYPGLVFGGSHLQNPGKDKINDILKISRLASLKALVIWFVLMVSVTLIASIKKKISISAFLNNAIKGKDTLPWRTIFSTSGVVILFISLSLSLAMKYHILGTDEVGQDIFYQTVKSIRTGLLIGTLTTLIMLPFAIILGIMAGYFQKWIDDIIQYIYTTLSSIPAVLLIASSILSVQIFIDTHSSWFTTLSIRADVRLLALCAILGVTSWTTLCRLLRAETLKLREIEYIQAARALGVSHSKIIKRHLFPNVMHIVIITVVLDFSGLVLAEAVMSYVGVGVDPTTISWGNMINAARLGLTRDPVVWWPIVAAFLFMFVLVLSANLFADGVQEAFDPKRQ